MSYHKLEVHIYAEDGSLLGLLVFGGWSPES